MRTFTLGSIALTGLLITSGCAYYVPVQQPAIARLSPEQMAAINSNDRLSADEKQRLTDQNLQVLKDQDAARQNVYVAPAYPAYTYPGYYYPYANPYTYPAYSPFYPGISLSLGYVWGRHSGGPYRGGWHGRR